MNRRVGLLALSLTALMAAPAAAQVNSRDHRQKRETEVVRARPGTKGKAALEVSAWAPTSGDVGTTITIEGSGFDTKTSVLFGGRALRPKRIRRNALQLDVPRAYGDGTIVLRHPDMGSDLVVGTFEVVAAPNILSFAPTAGVPGTRVELRGTGFRQGDRVLIKDRPLAIKSIADDRIVAIIPDGATTDYLVVERANGPNARSRRPFRVDSPAPRITAMAPASGPPGAVVRLSGEYFSPKDTVYYGRQKADLGRYASGWLEVIVPANARNDEYFVVRGPHGEARTDRKFGLERLPAIARFAPAYGGVGTRVEIYGDNFRAGDQVHLHGKQLRMLQLRPDRISVVIPPNAHSGPLVLERGRERYPSRDAFEVLYAPEIAGFAPSAGPVDTRVTITGRHFTPDASVYYGAQKLRVLQRSDSALVVQIPRRARDLPFEVRSRGGEARSDRDFQVHYYSRLDAIRPTSGPVGSRVTIIGRDFGPTDRFWLGGVELPIDERRGNRVALTIVPGARTGAIVWESFGRKENSGLVFTVVEPPAPRIDRITPTRVRPGATITIHGDNFSRDAKVSFGESVQLEVWKVHPRGKHIQLRLPDDLTGKDYLWVDDSGHRSSSPQPLEIRGARDRGRGRPGEKVKSRRGRKRGGY